MINILGEVEATTSFSNKVLGEMLLGSGEDMCDGKLLFDICERLLIGLIEFLHQLSTIQ